MYSYPIPPSHERRQQQRRLQVRRQHATRGSDIQWERRHQSRRINDRRP
ncbi:MAG: hypothetical protein R3Y10_08580 [Ferrimonas sp.]